MNLMNIKENPLNIQPLWYIIKVTSYERITHMSSLDIENNFETAFREMHETNQVLEQMTHMYSNAQNELASRFATLKTELKFAYNRNYIQSISSRIKSPDSIYKKLKRRNLPVTPESIRENILDLAGVRIVCSYIGDVYTVEEYIRKHTDLEIVCVKDYIKEPKANGYRSLHLIINVPVYFLDHRITVPVEVQIRTMTMDFWACLEHDLRYKAESPEQTADMASTLRECSEEIALIEEKMYRLARKSNKI